MRALAPALAAIAFAVAARAEPVAQTADAVLAANQAAMTGTPAAGAMHVVYAWSGAGLTGTQTEDTDLASGAFVDAQQAGRIGQGGGFDTRVPWMRDISGADTPEQGGDKQQLAIDDAANQLAGLARQTAAELGPVERSDPGRNRGIAAEQGTVEVEGFHSKEGRRETQ